MISLMEPSLSQERVFYLAFQKISGYLSSVYFHACFLVPYFVWFNDILGGGSTFSDLFPFLVLFLDFK